MCQERFSCLTTLSIEKNVAQNHEFSEEVKIYTDVKARKVNFQLSVSVSTQFSAHHKVRLSIKSDVGPLKYNVKTL
jgi:hypothetical protein